MDFGNPPRDFRQRFRAAGRMPPKSALFKRRHVRFNPVGGRPTEVALRQVNRPVLAGPIINAAEPVAVHPTEPICREAGLGPDAVQPDPLRPHERLVFGPVHVALAAQSQSVPKNPVS